MKHYHWNGHKNFGDALGPLLFKKFTGLDLDWSPIAQANVISVGSIIDLVPKNWSGLVVGTGKLRETVGVDLSHANVLAVRGPLSLKNVLLAPNAPQPVYGDLGLLADELVPRAVKEHDLGLVPHWSDKKLAKRPEFLRYKPLIIDVAADPLTVIQQIGSCRKIVSSSLHGIILADALGIPRRTELFDQLSKEGGTFKFQDYALSLDMSFEIGLTQQAKYQTIVARQHELFDVIKEAAQLLKKGQP